MPPLRTPAPAVSGGVEGPRLSVVGAQEATVKPVETTCTAWWGALTTRTWTEAQWGQVPDDARPPGAFKHGDLVMVQDFAFRPGVLSRDGD